MCGIVAGIAPDCYSILLQGLHQIQNRGYDSAGICTMFNNRYFIDKYVTTQDVNALDKLKKCIPLHDNHIIGISHTRWATHGPKTDINSHPHISSDGRITVVHNGIIENYESLKSFLIKKGYSFKSETDTEVISNLIAYHYAVALLPTKKYSEKEYIIIMETAIQKTVQLLEGTWGIVILNIDTPNTLYCTRVGSPLLLGKKEDTILITSEQSGFVNRIKNYIIIENNDICIITKNKIDITH